MLAKQNASEEAMNFETSDIVPLASEPTVSAAASNLTSNSSNTLTRGLANLLLAGLLAVGAPAWSQMQIGQGSEPPFVNPVECSDNGEDPVRCSDGGSEGEQEGGQKPSRLDPVGNAPDPLCDAIITEMTEACTPCIVRTLDDLDLIDLTLAAQVHETRDWTMLSSRVDAAFYAALNGNSLVISHADNPDEDPLEDQLRDKQRALDRARDDRNQQTLRVNFFDRGHRMGTKSLNELESEKLKLAEFDAKVKRLEAEIEEIQAKIRARDAKNAQPPRKKAECQANVDALKARKKAAEADKEKAQAAYDFAKDFRERQERAKARLDRLNQNCPNPLPNPITQLHIDAAKRREEEAKDEVDRINRRITRLQTAIQTEQGKCDMLPPD